MSLCPPDYRSRIETSEAFEAGIREGRRQMLEEMLHAYNSKANPKEIVQGPILPV